MVTSRPMAEGSATAEGDLGRTPFAHLLVYALDRRLTGALFLDQADGTRHVVRLVRGAPVKVRPGDRFALLGEMLVEAGAIDQATLDAALSTPGLLGDMLLLAGRVERDTLEKVAEQQFVRRMVHLFELPPDTIYRYFDGNEELRDYGGDPASVDPLSLIWAGLRVHAARSALMEATLGLLGDKPMKLHPAATLSRFALGEPESKLSDHLSAQPATVTDLCALGCAPADAVRRFAYALLITRQLELGAGVTPLGAVETRGAAAAGSGGAAVGRMVLKSTMHRVGAAAPDMPGDGERAPRARRSRPSDAHRDDEPRSSQVPETIAEGAPSTRTSAVPEEGAGPKPSASPAEASSADAETLAAATTTLKSTEDPAAERVSPRPPPSITMVEPSRSKVEPAPPVRAPAGDDAEAPLTEADPFLGKSAGELLDAARVMLAAKNKAGVAAACEAARRAAPGDADVIANATWVRFQAGAADVKVLAIELDELLAEHQGHVQGLFYRAMLRKRLSDQQGAIRDLRAVLALDADHEGARRELSALEPKAPPKERPSLFGRLFKR